MIRSCDFQYVLKAWLVSFFLALPLWFVSQEDALANPRSALEFAQDSTVSLDDLALVLVPLTVSELAKVAEAWQAHLHDELELRMHAELNLRSATGEHADLLRAGITKSIVDQAEMMAKFSVILEMWRQKGGENKEIHSHEIYISALRSQTARVSDPRTVFRFVTNWLFSRDGGVGLLLKVLGLILAFWLMVFVARIVRKISDRGMARIPHLSRLLRKFMSTAIFWMVYVLGIVIVLGVFGVNVTPIFAVFGGLSFILGFALQDTLGNLASGLMIMVLKPFDTGDFIQTAGVSGLVDEMSVVSTRIRTFDNQIILVPNSKIWGGVITNVSASQERRVDLVFRIAYSDNTVKAIEILNDLVAANKMCLSDPEPMIFVGALGDDAVNVFCRPWVKTENYWTVYWGMLAQAKERFDAEGISIPLPQRQVHLIQD